MAAPVAHEMALRFRRSLEAVTQHVRTRAKEHTARGLVVGTARAEAVTVSVAEMSWPSPALQCSDVHRWKHIHVRVYYRSMYACGIVTTTTFCPQLEQIDSKCQLSHLGCPAALGRVLRPPSTAAFLGPTLRSRQHKCLQWPPRHAAVVSGRSLCAGLGTADRLPSRTAAGSPCRVGAEPGRQRHGAVACEELQQGLVNLACL